MKEEIVNQERDELTQYWRKLFVNNRNPFDPDVYGAKLLYRLLRGGSTSIDVRHFHDKLGWCAGRNKNCAGALYRTEAFIKIPKSERIGRNPNGRNSCAAASQNVHIEHTIQCTQFHRELWPDRPKDEMAAIAYLMKFTPTTAMTFEEKITLGKIERANHRNENLDRPFVRYGIFEGLAVWNIFTQKRIDLQSYGLDEHLKVLRDLITEVSGLSAIL